MSESTKMETVKKVISYLKYISPFYLARTGMNKILDSLFNRTLSDYKNDSPQIFVLYLIGRRIIRRLRRDGLSGLTEPTFIGIIGTVVAFYLCKKSYEKATQEYTDRTAPDLGQLKALGVIPESYKHTFSKPTVTEHFLSFVVAEETATKVSDKVSFIVTPVYEALDFIWESVKSLMYFFVSRIIFFVVLGILVAGTYITTSPINYVLGTLLAFVGLIYIVTELSQNDYYNNVVRPKIVEFTRPLDIKMTKFEIFTLGLTPKPEHIPDSLRDEWGVPDPEEYSGELEITKQGNSYTVKRLEDT